MFSRVIIASTFGFVLLCGYAQAQSVDAVLARFAQDPSLAIAVSDAVRANDAAAEGFCAAADDASEPVQVYVGAGLAEAHEFFVSTSNTVAAGNVKVTVCTCEKSPGQILSSFASGIGALERDMCSTAWRGKVGSSRPRLFGINARGGGNGISRN